MCVPLAEELDLLAELGDVFGESLNRSHFGGLEDGSRGDLLRGLGNAADDVEDGYTACTHRSLVWDCCDRHWPTRFARHRHPPELLYSSIYP